MDEVLKQNHSIQIHSKKTGERGRELFSGLLKNSSNVSLLNDFLQDPRHELCRIEGINNVQTDQLKHDLYKVHNYEWGGDQNNSLDKYLVSHYVKTISSYQELL